MLSIGEEIIIIFLFLTPEEEIIIYTQNLKSVVITNIHFSTNTYTPVSYTHLDVYKRQTLDPVCLVLVNNLQKMLL